VASKFHTDNQCVVSAQLHGSNSNMSSQSVVEGLSFSENKKKYITDKLDPILEEMVADVLTSMPSDPIAFMIDWLDQKAGPQVASSVGNRGSILDDNAAMKQQMNKMNATLAEAGAMMKDAPDPDEEEEEEEDDDDELDELPESFKKPEGQMKTARASVSAEAYGAWNQKAAFTAQVVPKSDEQKARLKSVLTTSFLFQALDEKDLGIVIGAMKEVNAEVGQRIINHGEDGDCLYTIQEGTLECKIPVKDGPEKVFEVGPGDTFGELALLYNCPRAANVDCATKATLWQLDRDTFNNIVKEAAMKKRDKYETFLKSVPLLSSMDAYERSQVSDALKTQAFAKDAKIVTQGDAGDVFFILEEGTAIATKSTDGSEAKQVMEYKAGDYFGELALLKNEPRAANIVATSECKVLCLDRSSFKKMLGPLQDILSRSSQKYN